MTLEARNVDPAARTLTPAGRERIAREFDAAVEAQALECSRGVHVQAPAVLRGGRPHYPCCMRPIRP